MIDILEKTKILKEFESFLISEYGIKSSLTIKNYISQVSCFLSKYQFCFDRLPEFVLENPLPARRTPLIKFSKFLFKKNYFIDLTDKFKNIKTRQDERLNLQTLTYERGTKLIQYLLDTDKELAIISMIIFDTGVRIRAILKLKKGAIEEENKEKIYISFQEKRKKSVRRFITHETYKHLCNFFKINSKHDTDYLFLKKDLNFDALSEKERERALNSRYTELLKQLEQVSLFLFGKEFKVSFHWLRRGAGNFIYEKTGHNLVATTEYLNHQDPKTTKKYLKIQAEVAEQVMQNEKRPW